MASQQLLLTNHHPTLHPCHPHKIPGSVPAWLYRLSLSLALAVQQAIESLSLALAIQGCTGRELCCSSTAKILTTPDYASCCHFYIQQYVIPFLSSSHLSLPSQLAFFFFSHPLALSMLSSVKFCLFRFSTFICLLIHLAS